MYLGNRRGIACQDGFFSAHCIGSVAFAAPASARTVWSVDLDDFDATGLKHVR